MPLYFVFTLFVPMLDDLSPVNSFLKMSLVVLFYFISDFSHFIALFGPCSLDQFHGFPGLDSVKFSPPINFVLSVFRLEANILVNSTFYISSLSHLSRPFS